MIFLDGNTPIDSDDILSKLGIKLWPFVTQLIAFLILFLIVMFFVYKPVKKLLKKRNEYIKNNIDKSNVTTKEADAKLIEANNNLNNSYKEGKKIINDSIIEANKIKESIISEAKESAKKEIENAKVEINNEVSKKEDEIRNNIVDVALLASSKVLNREVSKKDNKEVVDKFIDDLSKEKDGK